MTKIVLLILVFCGITGLSMGQEQQKVLTRFDGKKITGVDASGAFEIKIRQGEPTGVVVTIPARLEGQLVFLLDDNGELKLDFIGDVKTKKNEKFTAEVVCSSLEEIDLSGACQLTGEGDFWGRNTKIDISGAVRLVFNGTLRVDEKLEVDLSGASKLSAKAECRQISIDISGASSITLAGDADFGQLEASGASQVNMGEFNVLQNLKIEVSGASKATLGSTEQLSGEATGASKVTYKGNSKVQVNVSGAASLKNEE